MNINVQEFLLDFSAWTEKFSFGYWCVRHSMDYSHFLVFQCVTTV